MTLRRDDTHDDMPGALPGACRLGSPKRRQPIWLGLMAMGLALGALSLVRARPALVWNFTASAPCGLYGIERRAPEIGELVVLRPDESLSAIAHKLGALHDNWLLLKPLAAQTGDRICRRGPIVSVNGQRVASAQVFDRNHQRLPTWTGCRRLGESDVFLISHHPKSFDGRYFGPVRRTQILGIARPLLTWRTSPRSAGGSC